MLLWVLMELKSKMQALNRLVWCPPPVSQAITLRIFRIILKGGARKSMEGLAHTSLTSRKTTQKSAPIVSCGIMLFLQIKSKTFIIRQLATTRKTQVSRNQEAAPQLLTSRN